MCLQKDLLAGVVVVSRSRFPLLYAAGCPSSYDVVRPRREYRTTRGPPLLLLLQPPLCFLLPAVAAFLVSFCCWGVLFDLFWDVFPVVKGAGGTKIGRKKKKKKIEKNQRSIVNETATGIVSLFLQMNIFQIKVEKDDEDFKKPAAVLLNL